MLLISKEETTEPGKRSNQLVSKTITVQADYNEETLQIDYDTVQIFIKEDNKAVMEVSLLMDKIGAFNAIVDNIQWDSLYAAKSTNEVFNYETQDQ